ncbi:hypothetical protein ACLK1S_27135 [Escherichia coli]
MRWWTRVHADEQINQFTIAQSQVGYADRICRLTHVAGEAEKLRQRPRASTPAHRSHRHPRRHRPGPAVQHQRFMLEEPPTTPNRVSTLSRINKTIFRRSWW